MESPDWGCAGSYTAPALHQLGSHLGWSWSSTEVTGCWINSPEHKAGLKVYQRRNKPCCHLLKKGEDLQEIPNVLLTGPKHDGQMSFGLVPQLPKANALGPPTRGFIQSTWSVFSRRLGEGRQPQQRPTHLFSPVSSGSSQPWPYLLPRAVSQPITVLANVMALQWGKLCPATRIVDFLQKLCDKST